MQISQVFIYFCLFLSPLLFLLFWISPRLRVSASKLRPLRYNRIEDLCDESW